MEPHILSLPDILCVVLTDENGRIIKTIDSY